MTPIIRMVNNMAKSTKIALKYRDGVLPPQLASVLNNADEGDLRILIAVMMLADKETGIASIGELPALLETDRAEIDASLKFWRGAGVLGTATVKAVKEEITPVKKAEKEEKKPTTVITTPTAHRNGALERGGTLETYSSSQLAGLMEKRRVSAEFIDEAQRIFGKVFRTYDTGILVGIVDQLGFEEEAVLSILAYTVKRGKRTMRYAEQVAMALYDEGILETAEVLERIQRMEQSGEVIAKVRALFGAAGREMTATEKKLFTAWTEKFAYDIAVIRLAYDITVDRIQKPAPKYTNSILEAWYAEGLRTEADVRRYIEAKKEEKEGEKTGAIATPKSYDVEDFFEAALKRSYEELQ